MYLYLDLETAGVDPENQGILEISARSDLGNINLHSKSTSSVDVGALVVNKLRISDITSRIVCEETALLSFLDYLLNLKKNMSSRELIVVGQNVQFDTNYLKIRLKKYGYTNLEAVLGYKIVDLHSLTLTLMEAGLLPKGKTSLSEIAHIS